MHFCIDVNEDFCALVVQLVLLFQIEDACRDLVLSEDDLKRVMAELLKGMNKGLSKEGASTAAIQMLPSYVRAVPNGTETGNFLALDLGGTNFRVLLIELRGHEASMISQIYRVPESVMRGTGTGLFDHIAECMSKFMNDNHIDRKKRLPLGFTFSFACQQEGLTKAKLIKWSKGFCASGVENKDVVTMLREACQRRKDIDIDVVAVLNDTVGTLMACAFKENSCEIGVIVGTGTNACYMEKISRCYKLADEHLENDSYPDEMIINTEWGAFGDDGVLDFIRTEHDDFVDKHSINPGRHLFEKMISGMYMGEIVRVVLCSLSKKKLIFGGNCEAISQEHCFPTKYVSEIEAELLDQECQTFAKTNQILEDVGIENITVEDCASVAYVCKLVSTRAAYLCAAGVATLLNRMQKKFVTVGVDGSVYRFHPTFPRLLGEKIRELIDPELDFQLMLSEDGSGRGAALVAAVASRINQERSAKKSRQEQQIITG
uniref:Phosphotransferase n=1 Tax=Syphacia muris TaxID=451379 RepID=A0A0N5AW15_9BILA